MFDLAFDKVILMPRYLRRKNSFLNGQHFVGVAAEWLRELIFYYGGQSFDHLTAVSGVGWWSPT